ncbi:multidrug effflux MFS transporter [Roseibium limicola]|uniref:Bcr/CflA family efflux transporter n=1 Tax=Roseibium limicola TaxID=2816037 RepID=A0A939EJJ7_9HYPH|nr:multidrug effflux MFS transporter [Roseibium limicola]MBO0343825.1 multidrug effflux MFS transporter [Roseibium limicola]
MSAQSAQPASTKMALPFAEFVVMIAALMALNALAMDVMLPALPNIGQALNIVDHNDRQQILVAYLIGFGVAQLFYGPISDAYGRRTLLLAGLALYALASVGSLLSNTLDQLLLSRLIQGIGCAATRVIAVSVVRDCYSGRRMGQVMSLVMMIFMAVPVIAPSIGQAILLAFSWHWIFSLLLGAGLIMLVWCWIRLPETLLPENRQPLKVRSIGSAYLKTVSSRTSLGYMLAMTFVFGGLFSFITMSQQIFVDVYGLGVWFPLVFASIALTMSAASFLNSRLVGAIGMRRLSHAATCAFTLLGFALLATSVTGQDNLILFVIISALLMSCFGFIGANFNTMAMEPLGSIAGTASSVLGFVTTLGGAILGYIMGKQFDGTTLYLGIAFSLYGMIALGFILIAEKGRLFNAHHDDEDSVAVEAVH